MGLGQLHLQSAGDKDTHSRTYFLRLSCTLTEWHSQSEQSVRDAGIYEDLFIIYLIEKANMTAYGYSRFSWLKTILLITELV